MAMHFNRRMFLAATAAGGAIAALNSASFARGPSGFFARRGLPIGLQLYTLGDEARTDLAGSLARVAAIGYREIELPELYGRAPADIRAMADRAGLKLASVHLALSDNAPPDILTLGSEPRRIAADLHLLGIQHAVLPSLPLPRQFPRQPGEAYQVYRMRALNAAGPEYWKRIAGRLNEIGTALRREGLTLGYHNHGFEFAPSGETTGWNILVRETDPRAVSFEVDVGWVAAAGLDPVRFLSRHSARINQLHLKDVKQMGSINAPSAISSTDVGSGIMDWQGILQSAYRAGVRHFYVEQEPPFVTPRIDAVAKSFSFLNNLK